MSRESKVEEELYRVMKNVLVKNKYTIEGVRFVDVEPQKKADSGRADLAVIIHPSKVLLVIECKKKVGAQGPRAFQQFDPMSSLVIDQALNYAVHLGADVFATTNGNVFALFDMPKKGEGFRIDTNRLFIKEASVTEEIALQILTLAARVHTGAKIEKTPLDWAFIIRLRSFVEYLSIQLVSPIKAKLRDEPAFKVQFEAFTKLVGTGTPKAYAREAAYILMNKIIFYKTLERSYPSLRKLIPIKSQDPKEYAETLRKCFIEAILATDDFEPVFSTGIYDEVPFPDDPDFLDEINSFIEEMGKYRLEEIGSDVLGPVFENLIKDEERHQLGQFYTPPQIAELIVRWGVRAPSDIILDPAVGCGTFPVKAYKVLVKLKPLSSNGAIHKEILSQIFAVDINPFPAQLTAVNLSMRDVQHPTSEMNIVVDDFFNVSPKTPVFSPFAVRSAEGQKKRKIIIPDVDVVVANPPYTRYVEISPQTLKSIQAAVGQTLARYGLHGGIRGTVTEIGIYIYFVVYSAAFLKDGGRLGMIVSNGWLQTEYGMAFSKFLLDNFKIRAIIDFSTRLFEVPLIATCVILLEKHAAREERENNDVLFAYVSGKKTTVNHLLHLIEGSTSTLKGVMTRRVRQSELTAVQKWIQVMFNPDAIEEAIRRSPLVVPMKELFQPLRGNTNWSKYGFEKTLRPGVGPGEFFELDKGTISKWGLEKYAHPAITSIRKSKFFTFDKKDWSATATAGGKAYYFLCHAPKSKLAKGPGEYIRWGETRCRTTIRETRGGGEICSQTWICKEREKAKGGRFCGWYDLGGVIPAPIFAVRHGWYKTRFSVSNFNVAMYDAAIALIPKTRLTITQIDALAGYLNSNFCQLYIETHGRATSGGVIGLETKVAETIPILDVRKLEAEEMKRLAKLFGNLEKKARQIGGADTLEHIQSLNTEIEEIDLYVGKLLGLEDTDIASAESLVRSLVQRRTSRVREAKPESIVGENAPKLKLPRKSVRSRTDTLSVPLDRWT